MIEQDLLKYGYELIERNDCNNSVHGIVLKYGRRFFFKVSKNFHGELAGYLLLHDRFPIPYLKFIIPEANILVYEFFEGLYSQKGTVYCQKFSVGDVDKLCSVYKRSSLNLVLKDSFPVDKFFRNRVSERIVPWYFSNNNLFLKNVVINGKKCTNTLNVLDMMCEYFEDRKLLTCVLSQGDPTDVNMSFDPIFADFECAGFNPIISELATFFWCHLIAGHYFYPKYHPEAYKQVVALRKPNISYKISGDVIYIDFSLDLSASQILLIKSFFAAFPLDKINSELEDDFLYFLLMRIFGTFDVTKMSEEDIVLSIALANVFFVEDKNIFKYVNKSVDVGVLK